MPTATRSQTRSRVGLAAQAATPIQRLSGGQQQRAFIAKALAGEPGYSFSTSRPPVSTSTPRRLSARFSAGCTRLSASILYVSHEFGAVERFVERVILVRGGIVFDGPPASSPPTGTTHPMFILDADFMRIAFATGAVVGVLAPAVGFFLVQRQMSLIGDGIGHAAFAGVAAGYLFGVSPVGAALVAATLAAVGVEWLRSRHRTAGDQALALIFYTGIAAGVVLVSAAGALNANLFSFLFGSI
jgi:hypothetical protein